MQELGAHFAGCSPLTGRRLCRIKTILSDCRLHQSNQREWGVEKKPQNKEYTGTKVSLCILWFVFIFTAELAFQKNMWSETHYRFFLHSAYKPASMKLMFKIHALSSSPVFLCIPMNLAETWRSHLLFPLFSVWIDHSQVRVNRRKTTFSSLKAHYLASPLLAKASSYLGSARAMDSQRPLAWWCGKERGGVNLC